MLSGCDPRALLFLSFLLAFLFLFLPQPPPLETDRPTPMWRAVLFLCHLRTRHLQQASLLSWGLVLLGEGRKDRDTGTKVLNIGVVGWCLVIPLLPGADSLHGWSHVGATEKKTRARRGKISTCYVRDAPGVLSVLLDEGMCEIVASALPITASGCGSKMGNGGRDTIHRKNQKPAFSFLPLRVSPWAPTPSTRDVTYSILPTWQNVTQRIWG